jgi:hypothetical protein
LFSANIVNYSISFQQGNELKGKTAYFNTIVLGFWGG